MTNQVSNSNLTPMILQGKEDQEITARFLAAQQILEHGKVPAAAIQRHTGRGGRTFDYISHVYATELLHEALSLSYSFDVLSYDFHADNSATALCRLTIYVPVSETEVFPLTITEVGAFDGPTSGMSAAMKIASAASRGLLRCLFRRFLVGKDLYPDSPELVSSAKEAWTRLSRMAQKGGIDESQIVAAFHSANINKDNLIDRFPEAWALLHKMATEKKYKDVPDSLDPDAPAESEEPKPAHEELKPEFKEEQEHPPMSNEEAYSVLGMYAKARGVSKAEFVALCQANNITRNQLKENFAKVRLLLDTVAARSDPKPEPTAKPDTQNTSVAKHDWKRIYAAAKELDLDVSGAQEVWMKKWNNTATWMVFTDDELIAALSE